MSRNIKEYVEHIIMAGAKPQADSGTQGFSAADELMKMKKAA